MPKHIQAMATLMRKDWAEVRSAGAEFELLLYGDIGEDWWGEESNTAKAVTETLATLGAGGLTVRINSFGGLVSDGLAIHNAIRRHQGAKSVEIDGVAMSIASLIAMAGDTVRMAENGLMMVHAPWTMAYGNAVELRETADVLDQYAKAMVSSYARKTQRPTEELLALITDGQDHYYTAAEAMDFGFVDEISDALPVAAAFDLSRFRRKPAAAAAFMKLQETPTMDEDETLAPQPSDLDTGEETETELESQARVARDRENERIRGLGRMMKHALPDAEALGERVIAIDGTEADMKAELRKAMAAARPAPIEVTPRQPRIEQRVRYKQMVGFTSEEDAYRAGMWARAIIFKDPNAKRWCKDAGVRMAMTGNTGIGGGVLVPDEMSQAIIDLRETYGVARRECEVVPMGSDTMTTPRATADPEAYFEGETDSATEDDTDWDNVELVAKKIRTLVKIPNDLIEDAIIDLASDTARRLARSYAKKEDDCLYNGDGSSTYGGIVGIRPKIIDGNHGAGAVVALTAAHDTFAEIDNDDLVAVTGALPEYAEDNAKWHCSKRANSLVFDALKAAAGGNTITTLEGKPQREYLGDPIVLSSKMPSGASTDYSDVAMLIYGDLRQGVKLGDRRGFSVQVLNELYAANDQIGVIGRERFDIVVHSLGDTTDAGPIVALVGGAS